MPKNPRSSGGRLPSLSLSSSTLVQALQHTVDRFPRKVFLHFEKEKITFSQFNFQVNRLANYLSKKIQIKKGEKVCLFAQNSIEFPVAFCAILKLGGIVIPINSFFKAEELAFVVKNSQSRLLLVSESLKSVPLEAKEKFSLPILSLETLQQEVNAFSSAFEAVPITAEDLAVFIYTSGTTGKPKGAMLTHRNFLSNIEGALKVIEMTHRDRFLVFLPLFHSFTLTVLFLIPLVVGAKILLIAHVKNPKKILKGLFWDRATLLAGIPHVYDLLSHKKLPFFVRFFLSLRFCISGAAPLPEATLKRFEQNWKLPLLEGYGLSEASPVVSINPLYGVRKPLSVGLPLPNVKVKIVDEQGKVLPPNSEGEICVQGPNVMRGYFNEKEETDAVLKEGWLFTGDLGKIDLDGYLFILDRKKDLILVKGINVYPREIEELLKQNPKIKECAVVGMVDPKRGEAPVAHLVLKEQEEASAHEIREWCLPHLANYKIPVKFIFHTELPKTSTGKILKRALK